MGLAYDLMVYYMEARLLTKRRVPLALESQHLQNFVELSTNQGSSKYIRYTCEGELSGYTVPPTYLLDLLESGAKTDRAALPERPIGMDAKGKDNQLPCNCGYGVNANPDGEYNRNGANRKDI